MNFPKALQVASQFRLVIVMNLILCLTDMPQITGSPLFEFEGFGTYEDLQETKKNSCDIWDSKEICLR